MFRASKRMDKDMIGHFKRILSDIDLLMDKERTYYQTDYHNTTPKEFEFQLKKFRKATTKLKKTAEAIFGDVRVFHFSKLHYLDEDIREEVLSLLFKIESEYEKIGIDEFWRFTEKNMLLYLLEMISANKSGYLQYKKANERLIMFQDMRHGLKTYFKRYEIHTFPSTLEKFSGIYFEKTHSPRTTNTWSGYTHYAITENGENFLKENEYDDLAKTIIEVIELILKRRKEKK